MDGHNDSSVRISEERSSVDEELGTLPAEAIEALQIEESQEIQALGDSQSISNEETRGMIASGITQEQLAGILRDLQNHNHKAVSRTWANRGVDDVRDTLKTAETLRKLRVVELNVIISHTKHQQQTNSLNIMNSWSKLEKVNGLCRIFGDGSTCEPKPTIVDKVHCLKTLASNVLHKKIRLSKSPSKHTHMLFVTGRDTAQCRKM